MSEVMSEADKNPKPSTLENPNPNPSYGVTFTVMLTVTDGPCYTHPLKGLDG
jgi:hypothetical protein